MSIIELCCTTTFAAYFLQIQTSFYKNKGIKLFIKNDKTLKNYAEKKNERERSKVYLLID